MFSAAWNTIRKGILRPHPESEGEKKKPYLIINDCHKHKGAGGITLVHFKTSKETLIPKQILELSQRVSFLKSESQTQTNL